MKNEKNKVKSRDARMRFFARIIAGIMALLMVFAAISTCVYYFIQR